MKPICCGLFLLLVLLSHMLCGQSKTNAYSINPNDDGIYYYVSDKGGEDKFPGGTVVKPFKTLRFVKQVIRNSRKQFNKNVTVFIREGVYQLSEPLVFTEEDDSYTHVRITYAAYPGERVIISGALRLQPKWETRDGKVYQAPLNDRRLTYPYRLLINGRAQQLARYPNADTTDFRKGLIVPDNRYRFADSLMVIHEGHLPAKKWLRTSSGILNVLDQQGNANLIYQISDMNFPRLTYVLGVGGFQAANASLGTKSAYCIENIAEELDTPGEWHYHVAARLLSYMPAVDVELANATVDIPLISSLIQIKGTDKKPVRNLAFVGLEFYGTAANYFDTFERVGFSDWTVAHNAAVSIEGAERIVIANCRFTEIGGNALLLKNYNRNHIIFGNYFQYISNNAICIFGNSAQLIGSQKIYTDGVEISDNMFYHIGEKIYHSAAVGISTARRVNLHHNDFRHLSSMAVYFADNLLGQHRIAENYIVDFGRFVNDKIAIIAYADNGRDSFTRRLVKSSNFVSIEDNRIDNLSVSAAIAIALMEGTQNFLVTNNYFLNAGLCMAQGGNRRFRNNIWSGSLSIDLWASADSAAMDEFSRNIIVSKRSAGELIYRIQSTSLQAHISLMAQNNLWYSDKPLSVQRYTKSGAKKLIPFEDWQRFYEKDSRFADPLLNGNNHISSDSPALQLGIVPLKNQSVGLRKEVFVH